MPHRKSVALIVDDNPANVHELSKALVGDHEVICTTSGAKALKLASDHLPDIILLDVMMPAMDGYEVCSRLKALPETRDIPVIFVTARDDAESETRGLDLGAVDFITKPINPAIVRARVRNHLSRRRIEETLREAALELARLKDAAEEANRAKSAFLATMSHELRTPLTSIIGFSEIIRDQSFGPVGTPVYAEYAGDINDSGIHLLDLINDILDIAKIESGKMVLSRIPIDTRAILTSIHRLVSQRALRQHLELTLSLPADIPSLWADERAVKQIVYNMLSNAIKFTPKAGKIVLAAETAQDGGVGVLVTDTGIGIPSGELDRVLRPFEQIENCYSRTIGGTGLGLPLIKGLIELHGGTMAIQSAIGTGTSVMVRFPPAPRPVK